MNPSNKHNPQDFFNKYVNRAYQEFVEASIWGNGEDIIYHGTQACENAYHMAEHIMYYKDFALHQLIHHSPNSNYPIAVNESYKSKLIKAWPEFASVRYAAIAKKHLKVFKSPSKNDRKRWLEGKVSPETSCGAITLAQYPDKKYLAIEVEGKEHNLSQALDNVVQGWKNILAELYDKLSQKLNQ